VDNNTPTTGTDLCYPVLTPFKFKGNIVKPPALVQMSADEAAPYLAAQVIGEDAAFPPEHDLAFTDAREFTRAELALAATNVDAANAIELAAEPDVEAAAVAIGVDPVAAPDTTPPTVAANPAAGVPVAGKATKPKPGK
jgi:hypothetical protein